VALIRASWLLGHELERVLPSRPFHVRFWTASWCRRPRRTRRRSRCVPVRPRTLPALPRLARPRRAYVDGSLTVDDLDGAFVVVDEWEPEENQRSRQGAARREPAARGRPGGLPERPSLELLLRGDLHSIERDAEAVRYHYDVGNEFFALFLDESMTYSCGIFSRGAQSLEEAQRTKLELVASKLELRPGMRVLDVGCGWAASRSTPPSTTASASPASRSRPRRRNSRVRRSPTRASRTGSRSCCRTTAGSRRARSTRSRASAWPSTSARARSTCTPGPLDAPQARRVPAQPCDRGTRSRPRPARGSLLHRYVFPDGEPLPLSRVQLAIERAGFETIHVEGFRGDYATTLRTGPVASMSIWTAPASSPAMTAPGSGACT